MSGGGGWDAIERPDGAALLDIARQTLLRDILPVLEGELRLKAMMIGNAMAIALRERSETGVAEAARAIGDPAALCAAIRAGGHDPGTPDHDAIAAALLTLAKARCRISNPRMLGEAREV